MLKYLVYRLSNSLSYVAPWYLVLLFVFSMMALHGQEDPIAAAKPQPIRNTFQSIWLLDNQTVDIPFHKTLEWDIQHRFGTWDNGYEDYYGLAAPSNIRLGFNYVLLEDFQIGLGITKERKLWDFNVKYAILRQSRDNSLPISITYFGVAGIDSRKLDRFEESSDRFSYFNQIMIARQFSERFSLQLAPSFSYFNSAEVMLDAGGAFLGHMNNTHFAVSAMGRFGLTDAIGLIISTDIPVTDHDFNNPKKNLAFGIEFTTSSHAFQIFVGNYQTLIPQYNHLLNQNTFGDNQILLGFNISRLWNF